MYFRMVNWFLRANPTEALHVNLDLIKNIKWWVVIQGLRLVHTERRQRQRQNYYKMIFRRECSHWGASTATAMATAMYIYMLTPPICLCHCRHKWVSNPFHEVAIDVTFAVAVAAPQCEHPPIGLHTTHSCSNFPLPLPSFSVNEPSQSRRLITHLINASQWIQPLNIRSFPKLQTVLKFE